MNRGDIVEVEWHFSDMTGSKKHRRSWFRRTSSLEAIAEARSRFSFLEEPQ